MTPTRRKTFFDAMRVDAGRAVIFLILSDLGDMEGVRRLTSDRRDGPNQLAFYLLVAWKKVATATRKSGATARFLETTQVPTSTSRTAGLFEQCLRTVMTGGPTHLQAVSDHIVRMAQDDPGQYCDLVSHAVTVLHGIAVQQRAVPCDGSCWLATCPAARQAAAHV